MYVQLSGQKLIGSKIMKRVISMILAVSMTLFNIMTFSIRVDAAENNYITASFSSGYIPDDKCINLKLKSGFDFLDNNSSMINWELALTGAVLSKEVYKLSVNSELDQPMVYDYPVNLKSNKEKENRSAVQSALDDLGYQAETKRSTAQSTLIDLGYDTTRYYYYPYSVLHPSACFGYKRYYDNGKYKNIFAIVVRGTQGGADFWTDVLNGGFRTFEEATFNVRDDFMKFVEDVIEKDVDLKNEDTFFFITGHSLGGAIANRLSITGTIVDLAGHDNNKIYTYTFEAPHTCFNYWWMNPQGMSNAFNFKDVDDFVANVPVGVGAIRYGTDLEFSVGNNISRYLYEGITGMYIISELNQEFLNRAVENLDNQIFMTLFPNAKGGSVIEAPKVYNYGDIFGHHDMGLPLTYILQKGIEEKTWESIEDVLQVSSNEIESESARADIDDKIVLAQTNYYYDDGSERIDKYVYDSAGNQIKTEEYNSDGSVGIEWEFSYDSNGNQIKSIEYGSDGNVILWYEYEYDSAGNETKEVRYNADGSVAVWDEYEYDIIGNKIKETSCDINGRIFCHGYEYDDAGNRIRTILYRMNMNMTVLGMK